MGFPYLRNNRVMGQAIFPMGEKFAYAIFKKLDGRYQKSEYSMHAKSALSLDADVVGYGAPSLHPLPAPDIHDSPKHA
jgi:hypothetical protein